MAAINIPYQPVPIATKSEDSRNIETPAESRTSSRDIESTNLERANGLVAALTSLKSDFQAATTPDAQKAIINSGDELAKSFAASEMLNAAGTISLRQSAQGSIQGTVSNSQIQKSVLESLKPERSERHEQGFGEEQTLGRRL